MLPEAGIYALRHRATGKLYIGSSRVLSSRRHQWFNMLNTKRRLPLIMQRLTTSRHDWEFIVLHDCTDKTPLEIVTLERGVFEYIKAKRPDLLLNQVRPNRVDTWELLEAGGRSQSVRAWSRESGVGRTTIIARLNLGWTPEEAVGLVEHKKSGMSEGHYREMLERAHVLILDGDRPVGQSEAAHRLGCRIKTLAERLKRYRVAGKQARVQLSELLEGSERHRR